MPKFYNDIDFVQNQALQMAFEKLASAPGTPTLGQVYFDTGDAEAYIWDGVEWAVMSSDGVTNLSNTATPTTVTVESSTGDDTILAEANATNAGVLGSDKWEEIVVNNAKETNVSTDLSIGTKTATTLDINSSDGNNVTVPAATTTEAGLMTEAQFDKLAGIEASADVNVDTNIAESTKTATTVLVTSSTGTNATLTEANTTEAGLLGSAKWNEIVANTDKETNVTHTGDVTDSSGVLSIDDNVITNAKMADDAIGIDELSATGPSSTTFLRGDNTWATPTGSGNVSTSGAPADNEYAKFVNTTDIEGRSYSQVKTDLGLDTVVLGPGTVVDGDFPLFNGTTGYLLKTSGASFETTLTDSATKIPSSSAVKTYADGLFTANDAMVYKGTLGTGGTYTSLPTTYNTGWTLRVITAGTWAGVETEIGDMLIALVDRAGSGNLDADWTVLQSNLDGAVIGPASSTDNAVARFDAATGKLIQDSVVLIDDDGDVSGIRYLETTGHIQCGNDVYIDSDYHYYLGTSNQANLTYDSYSGELWILGGTEYMIAAKVNGEVRLYYNNVEKIKTTSTGIDVTGNIVVSGTVAGVDIAAEETRLADTSGTNTGDNAVNTNYSSLTQYTDEMAEDAVGGMIDSSLTYTDTTPELKVTNPVTPATVGFTIAAGTTSRTLTVALDANVAGTNTGDETVTTGTEVDTGTDNTEMVTPKAVADSRLVSAPATVVDGNISAFDGADGKTLKDSGISYQAMARRMIVTIENGTNAYFDIYHAFANRYVWVSVARSTTPWDIIYTDVTLTDANNCRITFATAPSDSEYTATVIG